MDVADKLLDVKTSTRAGSSRSRAPRVRRVGVATAKARLTEVLRDLAEAPVVIHSRGRDVGVLVDVGTFERMSGVEAPRTGGAAFLDAVEALKSRLGGGVDDFRPPPFRFRPKESFSGARRR